MFVAPAKPKSCSEVRKIKRQRTNRSLHSLLLLRPQTTDVPRPTHINSNLGGHATHRGPHIHRHNLLSLRPLPKSRVQAYKAQPLSASRRHRLHHLDRRQFEEGAAASQRLVFLRLAIALISSSLRTNSTMHDSAIHRLLWSRQPADRRRSRFQMVNWRAPLPVAPLLLLLLSGGGGRTHNTHLQIKLSY